MTKLISKMFSLATMAALVAGLTGCKSVCPFCHQPNQGFATIISQPVDQTTNLNKTAYFAVNVDGNNPSFQWFFRGLSNEVPRIIEGADHRELSFTVTSEEQEGFYFCVIDSYGSLGKQRTRTRDAYLLVNSSIANDMVPESGVMQPSQTTGSTGCPANGRCRGWVYFYNALHGGQGYFTTSSSKTKCYAKLYTDINTNHPVANNAYAIEYRSGTEANKAGCMNDAGTNGYSFNAIVNTRYGFTVYILNGTTAPKYYLDVNFQ